MGTVGLGTEPKFLTTFDVAALLGVSRCTLSLWRRYGSGPPFVKLGYHTLRYPRKKLESYLRSKLRGGKADA
jgi:predicted DNA-binding transcriptional regulator AlpA